MPEKKRMYDVIRIDPELNKLVIQHMNLMGLDEGRDVSRTEAVEDLLRRGLAAKKLNVKAES